MIPVADRIARLMPAHSDAAARLHRESLGEAWSASDWARYGADERVVALGAFAEDGSLAGVLLIRVVADEAELLTIAVAATWRRRGIGEGLLAAGLAEAARRGATSVHLEVAADNAPALRLYRRTGFCRSGRRAGYYSRPAGRIDAVLMTWTGARPGDRDLTDPVSIRIKKH